MKPSIHGTHGSVHMSMEDPLPTEKHAPLAIILFDCSIALQIGEARLGGSECNQSLETLYLALKMFMHKLSHLEAIIHASLARSALLKSFAFFKPRLP